MLSSIVVKNVLKPFINETIKSLETMAGLKATAGESFVDNVNDFRFKGYAIAAKTYGNLNMVILLHNYPETALAIGNKLRHTILDEKDELTEINEEMQAALAEWGNTIVGLATSSLESLNLGIRFEPPYFILKTDNMDDLLKDVTEIVSVPVTVDDVGRFYFNLLIIDPDTSSKDVKIKPSKKILIVDDSSFMRKSIKRFLKTLGYENVVEAENGLQALEMHAQEKPAIIFMDVVMPEMTGDEALEKIRDIDKETPIVMLSSVNENAIVDKCNKLGVSGYVLKPLTAEDGPSTIKKFLV
ncbi:MAG: CheY-like chemotaxis protein/CheY-specific phosphatase CheX [Sulfurimonas sp.]|jgi:CheY-like chemotaxis protein/CheY-specific phosphatase CheX